MSLEERIAGRLARHGAKAKRKFGGTCYMVRGNMAVGTLKGGLIVRVGKDAHAEALAIPGARTFDMTGRPMPGYISVDAATLATEAALSRWLDLALAFNASLPAKTAKPARKVKRK
jgi:TfoX/Sxy family transcriptional regulator of competence genes